MSATAPVLLLPFFLPCLFLLLFLRLPRIATKLPPLLHTDPFTLFTYGNRGINLSPVTRTPIESGNANSRPSFLLLSFSFSFYFLYFLFFFILYVSFSRLLQRDIRNKLYLLTLLLPRVGTAYSWLTVYFYEDWESWRIYSALIENYFSLNMKISFSISDL